MTQDESLRGYVVWLPEFLAVALKLWYSAQLSGPSTHDQCGVDQNDQRRHLATERLLQ